MPSLTTRNLWGLGNRRCRHDRLLSRFPCIEGRSEHARAQHKDAIAASQQLGQLGTDEDYTFAGGGKLIDDPVDVLFGRYIDAASRVIQK